MVAVRQAALVSDESALEACLRRFAIQIDDLYLFTFLHSTPTLHVHIKAVYSSLWETQGRASPAT